MKKLPVDNTKVTDELNSSFANEDLLLRIIHDLAKELASGKTRSRVTPSSDLTRDLGIDSLSRIELLMRIEKAFDVSLAEKAATTARTPHELWEAVLATETKPKAAIPRQIRPVLQEGEEYELPTAGETLRDILTWHVERNGDEPHIYFYGLEDELQPLTYRALWEESHTIARALRHRGLAPGETAAMMLPTGRDFFIAFYGIVLAGGVPVPIYPPARIDQIEDHLTRQSRILSNARARFLISFRQAAALTRLLKSHLPTLQEVCTLSELMVTSTGGELPKLESSHTALIQYTSGSTADPKGVVLSHANLLANIRAMGEALEVTPNDVFVSWLPLYHDMGLIGAWLGSLYHRIRLVLMSPATFIARPGRWLWAIHEYGGTISSAPNFAYEICASRIDDHSVEGLNLSSWRAALNGAEPVHPDTLDRFRARFESHGLSPTALMPVYGLAENSVGLTFPPLYRGPHVDTVDRISLVEKGLAPPANRGKGKRDTLCKLRTSHPQSCDSHS